MAEIEQEKSDEEKLYEVYFEERKQLIDAEREGARSFDKAILTLAAGAFGLSIAFIEKIVPSPRAGSAEILVSAWALFGLSLLLTLVSFLTSQKACARQREILEENYFGQSRSAKQMTLRNIWATCTNVLNIFSIGAFILGVVLLAVFGAINVLP